MNRPSLDRTYFARVYAESPDPWNFATSSYEQAKYRATIDALPDVVFASGFEIGCSIGVLTARLAERCRALFAIDIDDRAIAAARLRCGGMEKVRFATLAFPAERPANAFDLIVISEVAYYWSDDDLATAIDYVAASAPGTIVELVHYLPKVADYVRDGDAVHDAFLRHRRFERVTAMREDAYRLDVLRVR